MLWLGFALMSRSLGGREGGKGWNGVLEHWWGTGLELAWCSGLEGSQGGTDVACAATRAYSYGR